MDNILSIIIGQILHGGPQIIALLVLIIGCFYYDRRRLTKEIDRLNKIVDEYYSGNITLSESLNAIRLVLYEIKTKL
jgi:hypothetical protein